LRDGEKLFEREKRGTRHGKEESARKSEMIIYVKVTLRNIATGKGE